MTQFNPNEHLSTLKGNKQYLEVKWRLLWFREQYPHGKISTSLVHLDTEKQLAVFKATVEDGEGGVAEGHGSESVRDFPDYLEKAETKALGRALASLGFGTQFALELDEEHRIVDSPAMPIKSSPGHANNGTSHEMPNSTQGTPAPSAEDHLELKAIMAEVRALGIATDTPSWHDWKDGVLGAKVPNQRLTADHLLLLRHALEDHKMAGVPTSPAA